MKMYTIAFLFNVRHTYPDPKNPLTELEADFDDPDTIKWIITHLKRAGFKVIPIEANSEAYLKLKKNKDNIDLVFNYSEGVHGLDRESHFAAILEMLGIPYTGSPPLTQALVLNKAKTKEILIANKIPTLPFQIMNEKDLNSKPLIRNSHLIYPLIVKPLSEGSGAGIYNKSIVHNERELSARIRHIAYVFHGESSLIEPFITGIEYSVSLLGNPPIILPFVSPNHSMLPKNYYPMDSFEVKWIFEEEGSFGNYLRCPAPVTKKLEKKIHNLCLQTWEALGIRDWCRIDIRCDNNENPYVLEVNSPAGLLPPEISQTSYFPLSARHAGIDYEELLSLIIKTALKRYSK